MERDRGIYRQDGFNGIVDYYVHDHDRQLIVHTEVVKYLATDLAEDALMHWLNAVDPVSPEGTKDPIRYLEIRKAG